MGRIRAMILKASGSLQEERGNSPGGLGIGVAKEGHQGPTTPDRPYRAVGNTASPASGDLARPGALCRVIGFIPPSRRPFRPGTRPGVTIRG